MYFFETIAHDEHDVSMNMNSQNGSPSSNSSSHSDQGSPSQNLQPQMYSSSSNKKSASNKKFADEPKQDTNTDSPTNQSHKIITKTAHKKHRISDKSDSDNSEFDESINDRDTQGLLKMQKGLKTDNREVIITLWKNILDDIKWCHRFPLFNVFLIFAIELVPVTTTIAIIQSEQGNKLIISIHPT